MKIFAKRSKNRSSIGDGEGNDKHVSSPVLVKKVETKNDEAVISYFSPKFESTIRNSRNKQQKKKSNEPVEHDIDALLAINPDNLSSKQRRVLRRYQERQNKTEENADDTSTTTSNNKSTNSTKQQTVVTKVTDITPKKSNCEKKISDTPAVIEDNDNSNEEKKDLGIDKDDDSSSSSSESESNSIDDIFGNDDENKLTPDTSKDREIDKDSSASLCSESNSIDDIFGKEDENKDTPDTPINEKENDDEGVEQTDGTNKKENENVDTEVEQTDGTNKKKNDHSSEANEMKVEKTENKCIEEANVISNDSKGGNSTKAHIASSIVAQLHGLNSKERRKLLRKLKAETGVTQEELTLAEEEAHRVADKNRDLEKKEVEKLKSNKRKHDEADEPESSKSPPKSETNNETKSNVSGETQPKKKKSKAKDWSHLPEEERKRREEQREKQVEAARLRASGEIAPGRHPLNSERRRANRRKPGRAGKIAKLVREQKEGKKKNESILGEFDANGYLRRKEKRHGKDLAKANDN